MTAPRLADVVRGAMQGLEADLRVAVPGRVTCVNFDTSTIDVQPLVRDFYYRDSVRYVESMPVAVNVPILFPAAGGMRITFPISEDDLVLLVFCDRSIDSWVLQGTESTPPDDRRHHLSDAIAIPGLRSFTDGWPQLDGSAMVLGTYTGTRHPAALGDNLRSELDALWSAIYGGHVHPGVETGGGSTGAASGSATKYDVESATVEVTE